MLFMKQSINLDRGKDMLAVCGAVTLWFMISGAMIVAYIHATAPSDFVSMSAE